MSFRRGRIVASANSPAISHDSDARSRAPTALLAIRKQRRRGLNSTG
jgi:hypothetical protein